MSTTWTFNVQGTMLTVHGIYRDGKPKLATKFIATPSSVTFVNGGKLYSSRVHNTRYYGTRWQSHLDLIREAIELGALPKSNILRVTQSKGRLTMPAPKTPDSDATDIVMLTHPELEEAIKHVTSFDDCQMGMLEWTKVWRLVVAARQYVWLLQRSEELSAAGLTDMEARKDAAYLERNQVVAALASVFPAGIRRTAIPGWSEDWHGCVYIDLPTGQASWHYHDSHAHLFAHLPAYHGVWDGHTTEEKYARLAALPRRAPDPIAQQLAEALEPFAKAALKLNDDDRPHLNCPDSYSVQAALWDEDQPTAGDLRRARLALSKWREAQK